jgi:hypothetical protein
VEGGGIKLAMEVATSNQVGDQLGRECRPITDNWLESNQLHPTKLRFVLPLCAHPVREQCLYRGGGPSAM